MQSLFFVVVATANRRVLRKIYENGQSFCTREFKDGDLLFI